MTARRHEHSSPPKLRRLSKSQALVVREFARSKRTVEQLTKELNRSEDFVLEALAAGRQRLAVLALANETRTRLLLSEYRSIAVLRLIEMAQQHDDNELARRASVDLLRAEAAVLDPPQPEADSAADHAGALDDLIKRYEQCGEAAASRGGNSGAGA
jgi:hypothetical protein